MEAPARKSLEQMVSEVDAVCTPFSAAKETVLEAVGVLDAQMWRAIAKHCEANGWGYWEYIDAAAGLGAELRRLRPQGRDRLATT